MKGLKIVVVWAGVVSLLNPAVALAILKWGSFKTIETAIPAQIIVEFLSIITAVLGFYFVKTRGRNQLRETKVLAKVTIPPNRGKEGRK